MVDNGRAWSVIYVAGRCSPSLAWALRLAHFVESLRWVRMRDTDHFRFHLSKIIASKAGCVWCVDNVSYYFCTTAGLSAQRALG